MKIFLLLAKIFLVLYVAAQEKLKLNYDIVVANKKIGTIMAKKIVKGKLIHYNVVTDIHTSFLLKDIMVHFNLENVYEGENLISGKIVQVNNGKKEASSEIIYQGNHYVGSNNEGEKKLIYNKINYSIAKSYFYEPRTDSVFSERYLYYLNMVKIDQDKYYLKVPEGTSSYYWYKNGICSQILIKHWLTEIKLVLKSWK